MNLKRIKELRKETHSLQTTMDLLSGRIMQGGLSLDQQILHLENFAASQTLHLLKSEELYKLLKNVLVISNNINDNQLNQIVINDCFCSIITIVIIF